MFQHLKLFFDTLSNEGKVAATVGGVSGWLCNVFLLDEQPLTWQFFIRGFMGICFTVIGIIFGLIAKDMYRYSKPKVIKYFTIKFTSNGKRKRA